MSRLKPISCLIATIWLVNGLFCKVMNLVPRHQQIVERILEINNARTITVLIGIAEAIMAFWIVSGVWPRLNAATQIIIVAVMNTLEFFLARDLLLWGKLNAVFAFILILIIYLNQFQPNNKTQAAECFPS